MKLRRMPNSQQYYYLSLADSILYDEVNGSNDPKDAMICKLLLDKAKASHSAHCNCMR